jgi:hypothetical protein
MSIYELSSACIRQRYECFNVTGTMAWAWLEFNTAPRIGAQYFCGYICGTVRMLRYHRTETMSDGLSRVEIHSSKVVMQYDLLLEFAWSMAYII